ncbi:16S rRNA (uracil(1498)-N(3))-methyltransferase [Oxalobacter vibrioformis]|uniref:Ribosomal RNA small subunit methyltransferase E n=1 Tax=Oxalobacter vibrioformis TaxID=933080 RepID=A0A9E9P1R3_9BURK|nr:16S rRNA (uracil(1498)-N(3))-methyltransferase [Oxalobacter vibrioformis]WAW09117.1 16S rRNA (uracil(1498)-N(3))-methyltransferase [Oxalobacter vibrioformis]
MTRLYCNAPLAINTQLELPASAARHTMVLRLRPGDDITLFNGEGGEYSAKIVDIHKHGTTVDIISFQPRENELPYRVTLVQSMPEASKMDLVIEKAIELGVARICPVESERSVVRLTEERAEKRAIRWKSIIIASSEQSGRNRFAELDDITPFKKWVESHESQPTLMLSPHAKDSLADWAFHNQPQDVTLIIGPEGGFSREEEGLAVRYGAITVSLGTRILRTETAGMAAVSALTAIWNRTDP